MNNDLEGLTLKVKDVIEQEKSINPDIQNIDICHAKIITQIISNYKLCTQTTQKTPSAQMIFLGAPTGAGKDTLVRKVKEDNIEKNFVVLNMDMFRYYHSEIKGQYEKILDKDFAKVTNQISYELYYIIQEIILKQFPGTNVIVTGTMKDLKWVKEIVNRYKEDKKTRYKVSLYTLAVPANESAFSIFERYLMMVNTRENPNVPLRYTDLSYHNSTIKDFTFNVRFFENELNENPEKSDFDSIMVYRRNKDMYDLSENTLIYDSKNHAPKQSATLSIHEIMSSKVPIANDRVCQLLNLIEKNEYYLKSQGLYKEILMSLQEILPQLNKRNDAIL